MNKLLKKYSALPVQMKASFWFLVCSFLQKGISVITTPIFTRLLTTAEYGQYNVFQSWLGILTIFVSMNLYCGVYTQGMVKYEEDRKVFSSSLQGLCLTFAGGWTIVYFVFREFWNQLLGLTTVQMLAMLFMIWASAVFSFWSVEQRVDFKYRKLVLITMLVSVAKPVAGISLVWNSQDKVTARILGIALVELIFYTGFFFVQMARGKKFFSGKYWKYALTFNIPLIPHYLSQSVMNSADRIMIKSMVGSSEAGIYSLAYSVSLIMTMFNSSLLSTIEPWLYKKIKQKRVEDIARVAYPAFLLIAGVNLALLALAPEVVAVFAPPKYHDAVWVIPSVTMSVFFMFSYSFFAVFEFYYERTKYIAAATAAGAVLNLILNYVFIERFGYYAAGYTTLVCYMIYALFHFCFMRKICREELEGVKPYDTKILFLIMAGFMAAGFLCMILYKHFVLRYLLLLAALVLLVIKRKTVIKSVKDLLSAKREENRDS